MVTRVDRKPVIYGTTLLRVARPAAQVAQRKLLDKILKAAVGHCIPDVSAHELVEDIEDLDYGYNMFGSDETFTSTIRGVGDDDEDEAIRIARVMQMKDETLRRKFKREEMCETICKCQKKIFEDCIGIYFGMEGVYKLMNLIVTGLVFDEGDAYKNHVWCTDVTSSICNLQAPYMFIHPTATENLNVAFKRGVTRCMTKCWELYKKTETIALRLYSRKNNLAHSYHMGYTRKPFDPAPDTVSDFALPTTGFCQTKERVTVWSIAGIKYIRVADYVICLSYDDCVSLSLLSQCYAKTPWYFHTLNGYREGVDALAAGILSSMYAHICELIDSKKLFANFIRAIHILAQREFNDVWEEKKGANLNWEARSRNYTMEASKLDSSAKHYYDKIMLLASNDIDRLNVSFLYHALLGDEMLIQDVRAKLKDQTKKVRAADKDAWAGFIKFSKAYILSRYMYVYKKKPKVGGETELLNSSWANRCLSGSFTMPPYADWGKMWIDGQFPWVAHANLWHLECQDVALVVKDADGMRKGKYASDAVYNSELLYALKHGEILDHLTGSNPYSARKRIKSGVPSHAVILTCAPKAENAKPTWKKRITFAADNEFRKMQAEVDRNTRRAMVFLRGPSLGVDQHVLETQFRQIAQATATGSVGAISSHDISAWSESLDRDRKFEFERVLTRMTTSPEMSNIEKDWNKIECANIKQGCRDLIPVTNSTFQGFDGSECTVMHAIILFYCIDTAKRKGIIPKTVKADMADLIDDCVAVLADLDRRADCIAFWDHLKATYDSLGFEVDELKSVYSTIKAIYLGRRFLAGGEVPCDYKVFVKTHVTYEDPLRSVMDYPNDIFGALRNACQGQGNPWFLYMTACYFTLMEISHAVPDIISVPHDCTQVIAIAPKVEGGWGFPTMLAWGTNDIVDQRTHFNSVIDTCARQYTGNRDFLAGTNPLPKSAVGMFMAIKSQPWRFVGLSSIFNDPMGASRDGPIHADNLRKQMVNRIFRDYATAEPWKSLLAWDASGVTNRVRQHLAESGVLHAPTLQALVNCMPDAYRQSLIGKGVGSQSVLEMVSKSERLMLRRRVMKAGRAYILHAISLFRTKLTIYTHEDITCVSPVERAKIEREEFYTINGVIVTDHTFPDPVATFVRSAYCTQSHISPSDRHLRYWDADAEGIKRPREWLSNHGFFVPPKSQRVWEVANEYGRGWDQVSKRVSTGLAILARSAADGHAIRGLYVYFIRAWNQYADLHYEDTQLVAIQGSVKRLDSNPGSSTHQITFCTNYCSAFEVTLTSCLNAIPSQAMRVTGSTSHLHDVLGHVTAMRAATTLAFTGLALLGVVDNELSYDIAVRPNMVVAADTRRMATDGVADMMELEIADGEVDFGLLQYSADLAPTILVATTRSGWIKMINALCDGNFNEVDKIQESAEAATGEYNELEWANEFVEYSNKIIQAAAPVARSHIKRSDKLIMTVEPPGTDPNLKGDTYAMGVKTHSVDVARSIADDNTEHVIAAIALKSKIWEQLKDLDPTAIAALYYCDPDADYSLLRTYTKKRFWDYCVREVCKHKRKTNLADLVVKACRLLGVHSLELSRSDDADTVAQGLASFFGAHMNLIAIMVGDNILTVAGRKEVDYTRELPIKTLTHSIAITERRKRKEHLEKIIKHNVTSLTERITDIKAGKVKHIGDKRAMEAIGLSRAVELRTRRMVYLCSKVTDNGEVETDYMALACKVAKSAEHALVRQGVSSDVASRICDVGEAIVGPDGVFEYMADIAHSVISRGGNWDEVAGSRGIRTALTWIANDTNRAINTRFAVTASELAPRVHRLRVFTAPADVTEEQAEEKVEEAPDEIFEVDPNVKVGLEGGREIFKNMGKGGKSQFLPARHEKKWQMLFTVLLTGKYDAAYFRKQTGAEVPDTLTLADVRDLGIEDQDEETIAELFPTLEVDYVMGGVLFEDEWLNIAEAEGYSLDEGTRTRTGTGLF